MRIIFFLIYSFTVLTLFGQSKKQELRLPEMIDFYLLKCRLDSVYSGNPEDVAKEAWYNDLNAYVVKSSSQHTKAANNYGLFTIDVKTQALYKPTVVTSEPYVSIILGRERNERFAKEALAEGRVLELYNNNLYGSAQWLSKFIDNALDVRTQKLDDRTLKVEFRNNSSLAYTFQFESCGGLESKTQMVTIDPFKVVSFTCQGDLKQTSYTLILKAMNAFTKENRNLVYHREIIGTPYAKTVLQTTRYPIIPIPSKLIEREGKFTIDKSTMVVAEDNNAEKVLAFLSEPIKLATGLQLKQGRKVKGKAIVFATATDKSLGDEGYRLDVSDSRVVLEALTTKGFFYGIQSLLQLLPPQIYSKVRIYDVVEWSIPAVEIRDIPRFDYRGMHLDVGRHMFSIEFIKKYIDLLAMQKMNKFHWHLTEDQGWRIEIKKYPKLTEIGSQRKETIANRYVHNREWIFDGKPYGGYYTQDQIREVITYAAERQVEVIPEIDLPGHMLAALASYPSLGCTGGPYEVGTRWGIYEDVLCAGNEEIYPFIENVLKEVFALFPSKYIHIGGDECPKVRWKACPKCQAKIKAENLKDEYELQSYVIHHVEKFLNDNGKQLIGWDEILEGGIAPNATLMSWRGVEAGILAAKSGHDVIMTPNTHVYLDHYQTTDNMDILSNGRVASLEWTYSYEPFSPELTAEEAKNIKGVQANTWTEYIRTPDVVEHMVFPRAAATAEIAWSPAEHKDWKHFLNRMQVQFDRWRYFGVNYAPHYEAVR